MIFEDDQHSVLQDKHNLSFVTNIINFHGDKSFILNSLQKIKNNTLCKIKRKMINRWIKDYTLHLNQYIENEDFNSKPENYELSPAYAKQSYNKVLKENEYLQQLMNILNHG
ncbi:hypothetical protein ACM39_08310 [Chryseobacterium sp. FH2]|uniref:hypothetical protein n=1 Tax=Chryseobacterium sp. FH2 TaxID=1674291 RepID=UPI00065A99E8|nr:hypothetical protein [Chryseobacterium sp. FH2]KMQ68503.1 hypothetical protein ACM39_08310 [Chryseobacterium sp. FH2]